MSGSEEEDIYKYTPPNDTDKDISFVKEEPEDIYVKPLENDAATNSEKYKYTQNSNQITEERVDNRRHGGRSRHRRKRKTEKKRGTKKRRGRGRSPRFGKAELSRKNKTK